MKKAIAEFTASQDYIENFRNSEALLNELHKELHQAFGDKAFKTTGIIDNILTFHSNIQSNISIQSPAARYLLSEDIHDPLMYEIIRIILQAVFLTTNVKHYPKDLILNTASFFGTFTLLCKEHANINLLLRRFVAICKLETIYIKDIMAPKQKLPYDPKAKHLDEIKSVYPEYEKDQADFKAFITTQLTFPEKYINGKFTTTQMYPEQLFFDIVDKMNKAKRNLGLKQDENTTIIIDLQ